MNKFLRTILLIPMALLLFACGGGDGDGDGVAITNPPPEELTVGVVRNLSGTVAVGAPVSATLAIVDRNGGVLTIQSDAAGQYSVDLGARPGPYLIRIVPNDNSIPVMYSYATGAGVANGTPFTTLAMLLAYGHEIEAAFIDWGVQSRLWDRKALEQKQALINANFHGELNNAAVDPLIYDFFTVPFEANHSGIDAFLDEFSVSVNWTTGEYEIRNSSNALLSLNENLDLSGYYIGAQFFPDDAAVWELSMDLTLDGVTNHVLVGFPITDPADVPWRHEHFLGEFWVEYDEVINNMPKVTCDDEPLVDCDINVTVTQFENSYEVQGSGGIGTLVLGTVAYGWSVKGWAESEGRRENIDVSADWSFSWRWLRVR